MPLPARTELQGDPPWLGSLLTATANGVALLAWSKKNGNPSARTVYSWLKDREDIASRFAQARLVSAEHLVDEVITTARGPVDAEGRYDAASDTSIRVARDRLRVDTVRWLCGIYDPERLGTAAHKVGAGSISIVVQTGVPSPDSVTPPHRLTVEAADNEDNES